MTKNPQMKIGIFDSGLGGLGVGLRIMHALPQYDYVYLGDTQRVPYGNRSQESIYRYTQDCVDFLFESGCLLIILACNTASAEALRKLQQQHVPATYSDRKVLGVLIPAAEQAAAAGERIGVLATAASVASNAWPREIHRVRQDRVVVQQAAPLLVPLVENDGFKWIPPILQEYMQPLLDEEIDTLVMGCTHYIFLKDMAQHIAPHLRVISPEELVPDSLADYLQRHDEIRTRLSTGGTREFLLTDLHVGYEKLATRLTGEKIEFRQVEVGT